MNTENLVDEVAKRVLSMVEECEEAKKVRIDGQVLTALKAQNAVDKRCSEIVIPKGMMIALCVILALAVAAGAVRGAGPNEAAEHAGTVKAALGISRDFFARLRFAMRSARRPAICCGNMRGMRNEFEILTRRC